MYNSNLTLETNMPTDSPGKRPFYKYAAPDTALAILRNRTVRYSSPITFNDPFDTQSGLHFDFDLPRLPGMLLDKLAELASAPIDPAIDPTDPWGKLVLEVRRHFPDHGFPRDKWKPLIESEFDTLNNSFEEARRGIQNHWKSVMLPGVRVFCVSEDRNNLLMWAHYTKDHRGAVFEFWSLPDEDNPLSVASAVDYVPNPPPFFSESEFIDNILSLNKFDISALSRRYVYSKSQHWSYEQEWRVWYPLSTTALYDDMPIRESEFAAIYLGCCASDDFRKEIWNAVRAHFPKVRVFQAHKQKEAYALEYTEV